MFTLSELIDVVFMTLGVGYIFVDMFKRQIEDYDPLHAQKFSRSDLSFACLVTAPAVILHELMHKLVALFFGLSATFHAAYGWLAFGVVMKWLNTGLVFFVPGYVSISGMTTPIESAAIAFAGPATNGILYLIASYMVKTHHKKSDHVYFWALTQRINGFLFLFNMIPFAFFDGAKVFGGLWAYFVG